MAVLCYKLTSQQLQIYSVIVKSLPMIAALLGLTLSSYLQNTVVGSSTSAVIDSILSCDGVSITSGCSTTFPDTTMAESAHRAE